MSDHSPEPWRYKDSDGSSLGGLMDANGKDICWFGNDESYYPTAGNEPSPADVRRIVACVNFCRELPLEWIAQHRVRVPSDSSLPTPSPNFTDIVLVVNNEYGTT